MFPHQLPILWHWLCHCLSGHQFEQSCRANPISKAEADGLDWCPFIRWWHDQLPHWLNLGDVQHPWKSATALAPIVVGLAALVVFAWWQHLAKPHGLLPMSIFNNWKAIAAFYCALINGLIVSAPHWPWEGSFRSIDDDGTELYRPLLYTVLSHVSAGQIVY